jgi:signal peptidase II
MMKISNGVKAISLIILVLFIDQLVKIEIKTTMTIGESITVFGNWFFIKFIENPGMAFGLDIPGKQGKPILTIFRIIAVIAIGWYLRELVRKQAKTGLVLCVALIFAGAMGNIIDSVFYGILFNESTYFTIAQIFPKNGGYGPVLHGRVVDMLYFPIIQGTYPKWFPVWHGQEFVFFRPIFNIADSSISIGIVSILLFQKSFFHHVPAPEQEEELSRDQVAETHE